MTQADKVQQDGIAARRRTNRALIAATVVALGLAGCRPSGGSASSGTPSPPSGTRSGSGSPSAVGVCAGRGKGAPPTNAQVPGTKWPERRAVSPGRTPTYSGMAVDPATDTAYALVPLVGSQSDARYRLTCATEPGGPVRKGPVLEDPDLALASDYLWAFGKPGRKAVVSQINPRTLRVIRSITLPGDRPPGYAAVHLTAGYGHSVWAGSTRVGPTGTLYRLDTRSGQIMATATLPAGTAAYDVSYYPYPTECCAVYASAAYVVDGGAEGNLVLEFDATNGQPVATADQGLVTESVAGSAVTAAPDGVWDSFRTGMLGLTLHLRQPDLALTAPTAAGIAQSPATGLFHWAMYATTVFGGGSLWLTNQSGRLACLDPGNGRIRAIERLSQSKLVYQLFAADPVRHLLFGAVSQGLVVISPPAACWVAAPTPSISG
jgi:hypothetical protein